MNLNVMMDAASLFPNQFHPQDTFRTLDLGKIVKAEYTRTERPVKYYLIDFGLSGIYDPHKGRTIDLPVLSGDKTVPEYQNNMDRPHEVYPTDVYYIGNLVREELLQVDSLEFTSVAVSNYSLTSEIRESRVHASTHRRHGPSRSEEASHYGRGREANV